MYSISRLFPAELKGESNGYDMLGEEKATELPGGDSQTDESCAHSSDESEDEMKEKGGRKEDQQVRGTIESDVVAHDCSGSRPLLLDSEDDEEQGPESLLNPSQQSLLPTQPSTTFHQPTPNTFAQNHSQQVPQPSGETDVITDVFSKAPFRITQEEGGDVFANAPFKRAPVAAQRNFDVFLQAPFGKRMEAAGVSSQSPQPSAPYPQPTIAVTPEQVLLGQVVPQPFRPQALAKYSRHFEGPLPQQPVAAHKVVSNVTRQAAVGSVPVGPLHSWTSEVSAVDPFVSAPFHLKAPQEKP